MCVCFRDKQRGVRLSEEKLFDLCDHNYLGPIGQIVVKGRGMSNVTM